MLSAADLLGRQAEMTGLAPLLGGPGGEAMVVLGEAGMGIVDATTFDLDEVSSAPYLDPDWLTPVVGNGIFALAHPVNVDGASAVGSNSWMG